jgi:hypothetical protein
MASNINPNNINGNYPVAGQDNDSQGFRDNFTNIKTNLTFGKNEIEDLQGKVLLKSSLTGTTLDNDLANAVLYRAQLKSPSVSFKDIGNSSGILSISFLDGTFQKITTNGANTLGLTDFPAAGTAGTMRLWINVQNVAHTLTLPVSVTLGLGTLANGVAFDAPTKTVTFGSNGNYLLEFTTVDGGQNFWVLKIA